MMRTCEDVEAEAGVLFLFHDAYVTCTWRTKASSWTDPKQAGTGGAAGVEGVRWRCALLQRWGRGWLVMVRGTA
jgi:hypothetical protein